MNICSSQTDPSLRGGNPLMFLPADYYYYPVIISLRPCHLSQDAQLKHPGTCGGREGGVSEGDIKMQSGQEVALLFSGSPRFSFQSTQRSVLSLGLRVLNKQERLVATDCILSAFHPHRRRAEGRVYTLESTKRGVAPGRHTNQTTLQELKATPSRCPAILFENAVCF